MLGNIKSFAELAARGWCCDRGLDMSHFKLTTEGNEVLVEDGAGNSLRLVYDNDSKCVYVKE